MTESDLWNLHCVRKRPDYRVVLWPPHGDCGMYMHTSYSQSLTTTIWVLESTYLLQAVFSLNWSKRSTEWRRCLFAGVPPTATPGLRPWAALSVTNHIHQNKGFLKSCYFMPNPLPLSSTQLPCSRRKLDRSERLYSPKSYICCGHNEIFWVFP